MRLNRSSLENPKADLKKNKEKLNQEKPEQTTKQNSC